MEQTAYSKWKKAGVYGISGGFIYMIFRYAGGILLPFALAFLLLYLLYPAVLWMKRRLHIGSGIAMGILLFISFVICILFLWVLITGILEQLQAVFAQSSHYMDLFETAVDRCCGCIEGIIGLRSAYIRPYLLESLYKSLTKIRESISHGIMTYAYVYAKGTMKVAAAFIVIIVITILLAKDYNALRDQIRRHPFYPNLCKLKEKVFHAAFVYIRAQLLIMTFVAVLCITVLMVLGIRQALLFGIGIGILDALPFLGTGSVLVPWAVYELFHGRMFRAAVLVTLYLVCAVGREYLEPKLIGQKLGIFPVYILGTIYAGIVLYGVIGVILGPLHALLTIEISRQWIADHEKKHTHTSASPFID